MAATVLTPMQEQYYALKARHPDVVLLFRLGDFYEAFDDDAHTLANILNITLTARGKGDSRTPMAGIPYHALDNYLPKLIKRGYKVALAEQVGEVQTGVLVERKVTKIYTPGTYTPIASENINHYLASIHIEILKNDKIYHLGLLDLSTGEFTTESFENFLNLINTLNKFAPKEILVSEEFKNIDFKIASIRIEYLERSDFTIDRNLKLLTAHFEIENLKGFGFGKNDVAIICAGVLFDYARENQQEALDHITSLRKINSKSTMNLDYPTIRSLELISPNHEESLTVLNILDDCKTSMGRRMLRRWLISPLKVKFEIEARFDAVEFFVNETSLQKQIREILANIFDIERLAGKIGTGSINPRDLIALKNSLERMREIYSLLNSTQSPELILSAISFLNPVNYEDLISLISKSIDDETPVKFDNGGVIKSGFNQEIDELREIQKSGGEVIAQLQTSERKRSGIESLKIKYNRVFGYYIEITKSHLDKIPTDYIRKQTLANAERFITPELKSCEEKILGAQDKLLSLEYEIFQTIVSETAKYLSRIQQCANALAQLDIFANFAYLALERNYVRAQLSENTNEILLKKSRHPVVEIIRKHEYIPNDVHVDENKNLIILTGPNMSGKSTYIRQIALIVIMAQTGSFVPCGEAKLSIVDRVFTRVGASDNLSAGESTFMVEMNETANILNNATKNSLLILDEVGRGTSTYDGVAIAWSVVKYIHDKIGANTFFATHYHELIKLENKLARIANLHVHVDERNNEIIFTHLIKSGGMDKSYGVHVAKMAGVPDEVVEHATDILKDFEMKSKKISNEAKTKVSKKDDLEIEQIRLL